MNKQTSLFYSGNNSNSQDTTTSTDTTSSADVYLEGVETSNCESLKEKRQKLIFTKTKPICSSAELGSCVDSITTPTLIQTPGLGQLSNIDNDSKPCSVHAELASKSAIKRPFLERSESTVSVSSVTNVFVKRSLTSFTSFTFTSCDSCTDCNLAGPTELVTQKVVSSDKLLQNNKIKPLVVWILKGPEERSRRKAQGFDTVPMVGSVALGMEPNHFSEKEYTLNQFHNICAKEINAKSEAWKRLALEKEASPKKIDNKIGIEPGYASIIDLNTNQSCCEISQKLAGNSRPSSSSDESSMGSDEELENGGFTKLDDPLYFNPLLAKVRKGILRNAGVCVDKSVRGEHIQISTSRLSCGCSCFDGNCMPESCECALSGIKCQVDKPSFPCPCLQESQCENPEGRVVFDPLKVHTHFLQTIMRLKVVANMGEDTSNSTNHSPQHIKFNDDGEIDASSSSNTYLAQPPPKIYQMNKGLEPDDVPIKTSVTTQYKPMVSQIDVPRSFTAENTPPKVNRKRKKSGVEKQGEFTLKSTISRLKMENRKEENQNKNLIVDDLLSSPYFPKHPSLLGKQPRQYMEPRKNPEDQPDETV
uniref:Cysteine/serine-rich nuclear protein N-terminal domain-containing protein n=1 Tax=Ditylenchus dipsaci TaxID=166011 RepID=A0A915DMS2_9BILA